MGTIIVFQLLLPSIYEWFLMIYPHFRPIEVFDMMSDLCPPWYLYWNFHYNFSTNIFYRLHCQFHPVQGAILSSYPHILQHSGYWTHSHVLLNCLHPRCQSRNQPGHYKQRLCYPTLCLIIYQNFQSAVSCLDQSSHYKSHDVPYYG